VLLLCPGSAADEPPKKANTAKVASVVFRFIRTNCLLTFLGRAVIRPPKCPIEM
jgi:hypothetical protein